MSNKNFKFIGGDMNTMRYEDGYWMDYCDYRLNEINPGKFILDVDKETKQITLTHNPFCET